MAGAPLRGVSAPLPEGATVPMPLSGGELEGEGDAPVVLRGMLAMLRGNRGASCVTYFTRDGVLRSVRPFKG